MANIIATPRFWKNKAVLFKPEATYGTDPTPTGAVNWIEARNVNLVPMEVDKVDRNIDMPFMGNAGSVMVGAWAKLSFDVAMAPSGVAGTAPKWAPLLLACGMAQTVTAGTSVVFNLVSTGHGSACAYINVDGTLHKLLGMRGDVKGKKDAKGIPLLSFSFDSVYVAPVAGEMPTVTRTGWMIEEGVNSENTGPAEINGVDLAFSSFDWSLGNKLARVNLPGPQVEVAISNRAPSGSITVLAPPLAEFDPFALVKSGATVNLSTTHGSVAGKKIQTDLKVRLIGTEYDQVDEMLAYKISFEIVPVAGNDELALTLL